PLVARENVEPLDAETLVPESDHRVGPDENDEEEPVATKATVAPSDSRHEPGRGYDPALVTLYLNDVGRVALLTHERERDLIANLHATRAAFAGIAVQLPAIQEAILDALEPLLHRRVTTSPVVATELIERTKLFRTLDRLHRTAGCRYAEVPRPLTC